MQKRWGCLIGILVVLLSLGVGCTRTTTSPAKQIDVLYGAGKGEGLLIFDVKDPASPVFVRNVPLEGSLEKVVVQGNYAYLVCGFQGLTIMDITNPFEPVKVDHYSTAGYAQDVYVSGDDLYLIDRENGVLIIQLKDGKDPTLISKIILPAKYSSGNDPVNGVERSGSILYVTSRPYFYIFNIATPEKPVKVGEMELSVGEDLLVRDQLLYAMELGKTVHIFSITNPEKLKEITTLELPITCEQMQLCGDRLLFANGEKGAIEIYDVSSPEAPKALGSYESSQLTGFIGNGEYLYTLKGTSGMEVVDLAKPTQPTLIQTVDYGTNAVDLIQQGNYLYVLDHSAGLIVFDVSDPTAAKKIGSYLWDSSTYRGAFEATRFVLDGSRAYIAAGNSGLQILDVSDPTQMKQLGEYLPKGEYAMISDVVVKDGFAYVAAEDLGLHVLEVSDPTKPVKVDEYFDPDWKTEGQTEDDSGNSYVTDVCLEGNFLYMILYSHWGILLKNSHTELLCFDLSEPGKLKYLNSGNFNSMIPADLQVLEGIAYVLDGDWGISTLDMSQPEFNEFLTVEGLDQTYRIQITPQKIAYVVSDKAVFLLDLSDSANIQVLSQIKTSITPERVYMEGDYVYLALGEKGVAIYNIKDPANPVLVNTIPWINLDQGVVR